MDPYFTNNRNIRVTGCKLVNSCLVSNYTTIHNYYIFKLIILQYGNRVLPTDFAIFELKEEDSEFINEKHFYSLKDLNPESKRIDTWIFTKIVKISSVKYNKDNPKEKIQDITLEDQEQNRIPLRLYDKQIILSYMLKKVLQNIQIIKNHILMDILDRCYFN